VTDRDDRAGDSAPRAGPAPQLQPPVDDAPPHPPGVAETPIGDRLIRLDEGDRALRQLPSRGWRRAVYRSTGGHLNLGPSATERQLAELERRARRFLRTNYRVGVLGKGGVGKTTVAAGVGSSLAEVRREDRVIAIDADSAFGKLGDRIDPDAAHSYVELATDPNLHTFADVRSHLGANRSGLFVLPGDPLQHQRLSPALYSEVLLRLARYFAVTIVDCGATMDSPLTRTVVHNLDAAIIVATPWDDGTSIAHHSLDWLAEHGRGGLLSRTIVALNNSDGNAKPKMLETAAEGFLRRGIPTFGLPFDRRLRAGGILDLAQGMSASTRHQFLEIAAELGAHFGDTLRDPH
jgi:MinD-like ATPase involved in chromosome partitioning or flagellar assembly